MAKRRGRGSRRGRAIRSILLGLGLAIGLSGTSRAQDMGTLYQAWTIVTGFDTRSRPAGFAQCLREVLTKVSGEPRLLQDPRVTDLAARADSFVVAFDYADLMAKYKKKDDQGSYDRPHSLTVRFDPKRIDAALADLGAQPWRGPRPVVVPVLWMRSAAAPYLLDADNPARSDQRGSFAGRAEEFGLAARIPTAAELATWGVVAGQPPVLPAPARPDEVPVAGSLSFDETAPGWAGAWQMRWHGVDYRWSIRGVSYDEAFRDIMRGVARVASGRGAPD